MLRFHSYRKIGADNACSVRAITYLPRTPAALLQQRNSIIVASNFVDQLANYCELAHPPDLEKLTRHLEYWTCIYNILVTNYTSTEDLISILITNKPTPICALP